MKFPNQRGSAVSTLAPFGNAAALQIRQEATEQKRFSSRVLGYWHLCSLDAPTVAALWTWYIAFVYRIPMSWRSPVSMFLAVWMLYAADRILDARSSAAAPEALEERHFFHHRHSRRFQCVIAACSVVLAALLPSFSHVELRLFSALGSLLLAYFFLIHFWPETDNRQAQGIRIPKELVVGMFFSGAVFIPAVARAPQLQGSMLSSALLLACACTLNCVYVFAWEHSKADHRAHWATLFAVEHKGSAVVFTLILCGLTIVSSKWGGGACLCALACALSLLSFTALHKFRFKIEKLTLRALVDFALIAPLALTAWLSLARR